MRDLERYQQKVIPISEESEKSIQRDYTTPCQIL